MESDQIFKSLHGIGATYLSDLFSLARVDSTLYGLQVHPVTLLQSNFTFYYIYGAFSTLQFTKFSSFTVTFFGLVSILHFDGTLFYILQAHLFSNFTARTLVTFHSTFSKKVSLRLYVLHISPPLFVMKLKT